MGKSRKGQHILKRRTSRKKLKGSLKRMNQWIRGSTRLHVRRIDCRTQSKTRGYYQYYGITFNSQSIQKYYEKVKRILYKWINRRGNQNASTGNDTFCASMYGLLTQANHSAQLLSAKPFNGRTVCGKAARTGLWGSDEVTNRSTRKYLMANEDRIR